MNRDTIIIQRFAFIGLMLKLVSAAVQLMIRIFPVPFLGLLHFPASDLTDQIRQVTLSPVELSALFVSCGLYAVLYFLLRQNLRTNGSSAGFILGLVLTYVILSPIVSIVVQQVYLLLVSHLTGAAMLGAASTINTACGYAGLLATASVPLLASAAAMNWQRTKDQT